MKIQVTQNHIDNGVRDSSPGCPVALAIFDQNIPHGDIRVGKVAATIYPTKSSLLGTQHYLPESAVKFIEAFDHGEDVEPFEFDLFSFVGETFSSIAETTEVRI